MENTNKYYRNKPIREFDLNKTMYETINMYNSDNLNSTAVSFLGYNMKYGQLMDNVNKLADAYVKSGVKCGDTVAICTINMPLVQENLLALSKIGVTSKWIDLRCKPKELIKNINDSNCNIIVAFEDIVPVIADIISETNLKKVIVASPKSYLNPLIRVLADLRDKHNGKILNIPAGDKFIDYKSFLNSGKINNNIKAVSFEKDRPSLIIQSSGSTGVPKSIIHTEYNFNSEMQKEAYSDLPFEKGKTMHIAIPPFIIYGLCNSVYAAMAFSMKAEMTPFISETTVYDDLGKFDYSCAAPLHYRYIYNKILELEERIKYLSSMNDKKSKIDLHKSLVELSSIFKKINRVKVFVSGGDKMSSTELLQMEHTLGKTIVNGYGNNEVSGAAIISPVYACKPDSIGIPLKGVEVACFDPETGDRKNVNEIGEICIQTDSAFVGYLGNPSETEKVKRKHEDGKSWIHTGDLGYVDEDGFVYIEGRSKRLIKRNSFKISPNTIENVIMKIDDVNDCVVVGVPDEKEQSVPMAYIEIKPDCKLNIQDVIAKINKICKDELPDYEIPKYVEIIEKIPYNNQKKAFKELENAGAEFVLKKKLS